MNKQNQILGRNPDKSIKSFPPYFFKPTQPLRVSTVLLPYTLKEKGGKPDKKPKPLTCGLRNPYRNLKSKTLKIMPRDFNKILRS